MPRSIPLLSASALLLVGFLALPAQSQTTAANSASAPAANASDAAKAVVADFYRLMCDADAKALDLLVFTDPQNAKAGRVLVQLALAHQRIYLAANRAFGNSAAELSVAVTDKDRQQFDKDLKAAPITIKGASAEVRTQHDGLFVMALKDGTWKLDFDKTQAGKGPLPKDVDLPAIAAQTVALNQLAADLAADAPKNPDPGQRRFKTLTDLKSRLSQPPSAPRDQPLPLR